MLYELAKKIRENYIISGSPGPLYGAGWNAANDCAADILEKALEALGCTSMIQETILMEVTRLKAEIARRESRIREIQESICTHPKEVVTREARSNTGNWNPGDDRYWYDCNCGACHRFWQEAQ